MWNMHQVGYSLKCAIGFQANFVNDWNIQLCIVTANRNGCLLFYLLGRPLSTSIASTISVRIQARREIPNVKGCRARFILMQSESCECRAQGLAAISYMGIYAPNSTHQARNQLYYSSAIHKFTKLGQNEYRCNFAIVLLILVLFAHIESSRGNYGGFNCHVRGLATFLDSDAGNSNGDLTLLRTIVTAWMQPRFQVWWARSYFSTLDVQLQQPRIVMLHVLQGGFFGSTPERRISVLSVMFAQFASHDSALNYAYYVLARIMQCTAIFHSLQSGESQYLGHECYEAEPWGRLLLRIAKAIDTRACIHQNTWTIGFSGLFLAALLRCRDAASGIWIEHWLQNLSDIHPTEEGSFPVYQALAVARAINQQRMIARDVFAVSQPLDDGGGTPKFTSYNSQMIDKLLIHGRCRATGELFTDCISI
ncbi:hypothetical protein UA08_01416 [Talaromyces atroroseus]|uniref:Transcription factor domain-containing protein n=1 Tax=Talaromyces atroroseus TaxID=1441469 RepID=A0A1Q5QC15_TALAT|nr:hypothetical protein UA08_01416 [Talaromyces atroroseus]OKL63492.1 hypothetical protein UA08_01416 [Talaromyces atroroseus]